MGGKLYFLPAFMGIFMMTSIVVSYVVAVLRGDVAALFPYISDTGNEVPEQNIFAQFLNMASFLGIVTVYLHYRLVRELTGDSSTTITRLAKFGLVCSVLASFGLSLVGNFQSQKIPAVHFTGAAMVFGLGVLYMFVDTAVTKLMCPHFCGTYILKVRITLCVFALASFLCTSIGGAVSRLQWSRYASPTADPLHWSTDDPGYPWHIVSTAGEWATGVTFILYFYTFIREFRKFDATINLRLRVQHLDQDPDDCACPELTVPVTSPAQEPYTTYTTYGSADQNQSNNGEPDEQTKLLSS